MRIFGVVVIDMGKGLTYIVHIVEKYVYNNKVCWYYDSNGIRYTKDELIYIYKNHELPESKQYALGNNKRSVLAFLDNMYVTVNGLLRKNTNSNLKVININKLLRVSVIIEDSNSGYNFYRYMIECYYREIDFTIVSSYGNLGILRTVRDILKEVRYDFYLLIYDNKLEDSTFISMLNKAEKLLVLKNVSYSFFYPVSLEEVLLSWVNLYTFMTKDLYDLTIKSYIDNYLKFGKPYFRYDKGLYMLKNGENVINLEVYLENYLKLLVIYKKSSLTYCYYMECCPLCKYNHKMNKLLEYNNCEVSKNINFDKFNSLVEKSLFCGIINIIDIKLGLKPKYLSNWKNINYLYKISS